MKALAALAIGLSIAAPLSAQTQAGMPATAQQSWKSADAAMTAEWRRTYAYMKALDTKDRSRGGGFGYAAATLESQRAWLTFRDRQCVIEGGQYAGGTAQPMARFTCLTRLTRERTGQLKNLRWYR